MHAKPNQGEIDSQVKNALAEDIGTGDLTAALIDITERATATLISREAAVACGNDWIAATFRMLDSSIQIDFRVADGDSIGAGEIWCIISGSARSILTAERTALNFAQLLSGTATLVRSMVAELEGTNARLLDTRKTIPGLRLAQKYAVRCGGGSNHRVGLYDGILLKENHIRSAGSIRRAVESALEAAGTVSLLEVEVENLDQLAEALAAGAPRILLDNFSLDELRRAVSMTKGQAELEASGNITLETIREIALTGVDFISCGQITKNVKATDLSLQFEIARDSTSH